MMGYDFSQIGYLLSVWAIPAILAITLHEAAHGWVAWKLGDDTAKVRGRVTFNPIKHVDPVGTILLPGLMLLAKVPFLFGYAKPVPVNIARLNDPRRDMVLVAAAGPGMNLLLAFIAALLIHYTPFIESLEMRRWVWENLQNAVTLNVILAVFNLLPIPPLDGGRVAVGLLPPPAAIRLARLERVGIFLVIGLFMLVPWGLRLIDIDFSPARWLILLPASYIIDFIAFVSMHG